MQVESLQQAVQQQSSRQQASDRSSEQLRRQLKQSNEQQAVLLHQLQDAEQVRCHARFYAALLLLVAAVLMAANGTIAIDRNDQPDKC